MAMSGNFAVLGIADLHKYSIEMSRVHRYAYLTLNTVTVDKTVTCKLLPQPRLDGNNVYCTQ